MKIFIPDILPLIIFGLFVSAALIGGLMMIRAEIRSAGGSEDRVADLCFWLLLAAIAGARCGAILYKPGYILNDPLEFFRIWNGGSFYFGGAVMAIIAGVIFIRHARMPLWKTADMFAPPLAIGHFFVWIGCFFSGLFPVPQSDSLIETLFSLASVNSSGTLASVLPRFLYLAFGSFLIFIILIIMRGYRNFDGKIFWVFVSLLSMLRIFVDTFGFPEYDKHVIASYSTSQLIYIFIAIAGLLMLFYLRRRTRISHMEGSARSLPL
jgi:phosphatidylglycerol:prolipoprotein diacylglycerol transferase